MVAQGGLPGGRCALVMTTDSFWSAALLALIPITTIGQVTPTPDPQTVAVRHKSPDERDPKLRQTGVGDAERAGYKDLLRQNGTGITKLLSADCESAASKLVISINSGCDQSVDGGGTQFSFRKRDYTISDAADIKLRGDEFIVGSKLTLAAIVDLGAIEIRDIRADSRGVKLLNEYTPRTSLALVKKEAAALDERRHDSNGMVYGAFARVEVGHVYAVRSIAYRSPSLSAGDKRDDVLIVLAVVAKDPSGNVTLVWKELWRKPAPKIDNSN